LLVWRLGGIMSVVIGVRYSLRVIKISEDFVANIADIDDEIRERRLECNLLSPIAPVPIHIDHWETECDVDCTYHVGLIKDRTDTRNPGMPIGDNCPHVISHQVISHQA
jgi:hypothetical protein